jgi:hypothetical protein
MSRRPRVPRLEDRIFQEPRTRSLMAECPRVVSICRWIWWTQPAPDLLGIKVRPDGVGDSFRCNSGLMYAINLLLHY